MLELTNAQQAWVSQQMDAATTQYRVENDNQQPNGRWLAEKKASFELQCYPLSEIIRRMMKIGNPDGIHNRDTQRSEFELLAGELDRREKVYMAR